jgi:hypothetical protein
VLLPPRRRAGLRNLGTYIKLPSIKHSVTFQVHLLARASSRIDQFFRLQPRFGRAEHLTSPLSRGNNETSSCRSAALSSHISFDLNPLGHSLHNALGRKADGDLSITHQAAEMKLTIPQVMSSMRIPLACRWRVSCSKMCFVPRLAVLGAVPWRLRPTSDLRL